MFLRTFRHSTPRVARSFSSSGAGGNGGGVATFLSLGAIVGSAYVYYDATQTKEAMEAKINGLTVDLAGKTNSGEFSTPSVDRNRIGVFVVGLLTMTILS